MPTGFPLFGCALVERRRSAIFSTLFFFYPLIDLFFAGGYFELDLMAFNLYVVVRL
jgi:hypothetical protein